MHLRGPMALAAASVAIAAVTAAQAPGVSSGTAARASAPRCAAAAGGHATTLLTRVPVLASTQMAATRDGGALLAFSSFDGFKGYPATRFTVLALDASGCIRWRTSLRGKFLARPAQPDARTILVASGTISGDPLRIYTLAASDGRLLHADVFAKLNAVGTTLWGDGRGNAAVVVNDANRPGAVKLTRRAGTTRWTRQLLSRGNGQAPAAFARPDGRMVVGYPRSGRYEVHTGTVAGSLGPAVSAGPLVGNFRSATVGLGQDATVAAVWQTATYGRPWRLRAAIRRAGARHFGRFAQLGFAANPPGTLLLSEVRAGVRVDGRGRVTLGYVGGDVSGKLMLCARASRAGRFGVPRRLAGTGELAFDVDAMSFGGDGVRSVVGLVADRYTVLSVDARCHVRASTPLESALGLPAQNMVDVRGRTWVVGQDLSGGGTGSRPDLELQIVKRPR